MLIYRVSETASYILIIFLAFGGFSIAAYINHHKKNIKEALVCPLKANCDTVIHSDYSKFLGIPVEILGMIYYGLIAVNYGLIVAFPGLETLASTLLVMTLCAFVFSIYLTLIQAFAIKNWCTWCLISASICVAIFSIASVHSPLFSALFSNILLTL